MHSIPPLVTPSSAHSGRSALRRLDAVDQVLADARDALAGRVLERDPGLVAHEPLGDLDQQLGRERRRVREPARHPERARRRPGQDRRQLAVHLERARGATASAQVHVHEFNQG